MKRIVFVALLSWWFMTAGGRNEAIVQQFGPFKDEVVCKSLAGKARERLTKSYVDVYVSECWEG